MKGMMTMSMTDDDDDLLISCVSIFMIADVTHTGILLELINAQNLSALYLPKHHPTSLDPFGMEHSYSII